MTGGIPAPAALPQAPVVAEAPVDLVPLKPETRAALDTQVERVVEGLLQEDLHTEAFKVRVQRVLTLGREEIADAAELMQGALMQRLGAGLPDQAAHEALARLRDQLEALNPDREGDLLKPRKLFGVIPLARNGLQAYFSRHAQAVPVVQALVTQLYAARDGLQRDGVALDALRSKLWDALHRLATAAYLARALDSRLAAQGVALESHDSLRAKVLAEEVLFAVRQCLQDILTQQAVGVNGYLALDVLKKTGRELVNGCTRVATTGLSALAVAQVVARATGHQAQVADLLGGVNAAMTDLAAQSVQFAREPALGIGRIREMLGQTLGAIEVMDRCRAEVAQRWGGQ